MGGRAQPGVQTVQRAFSVLELLLDESDLNATEIANTLELNVTTTHRILRQLETLNYVQRDARTKEYRLGLKCLELGGAVLNQMSLPDVARPHLHSLAKQTGETVHLMIPDQGQGVYIAKVESKRSIKMVSRVGRRSHLHCTALGKALLAHMPEEAVDEIIAQHGLPRFTSKTLTNSMSLKGELLQVRQRGYAIDDEEEEIGVRCIGAAVFDHQGVAAAAVSVAGLVLHVGWEKVEQLAAFVQQTAAEISKGLGYGVEGAADFG